MSENSAGIEVVVSDFGGVLTSPLVESFMAFQDQTGITTETLGKAMQAAAEAEGENPLFAMERGEITEVSFLEKLTVQLEPEPAVIVVPGRTLPLASVTDWPMAIAPVTPDTVSAVPAIVPVKVAPGLLADPTPSEMT